MTFLNPLALFALAAAVIPVVLHFLNLRKLRTVDFSSLTFLKELQKSKIRRLRIQQILLLILRTLLVTLLVLAFSRPTLRGSLTAGAGSRAKTSVVLLVDDSYSMTAHDAGGELLKQAESDAGAVLDLCEEGDDAMLVPLSHADAPAQQGQTHGRKDFALVRQEIAHLEPSPVYNTLDDAVRISAKLLTPSLNFNKELYIFSDFQKGVFESGRPSDRPEQLFSSGTRVFLFPLGSRIAHNEGIISVSPTDALLEKDKPFGIEAEILNSGESDDRNHVVSVFFDGSRVAQKGIDIPAGKRARATFTVVPTRTGFIPGFVELEDDDIEFDNRRNFSVHIPDKVRILLVGTENEGRYVSAALGTRSGQALDIVQTASDRFALAPLSGIDVAVIASAVELSPVQTEHVRRFVAAGGGLVVFAGDGIDPSTFNKTVSLPLGLPLAEGIDRIGTEAGSIPLSIRQADLAHPLFRGMFESPSDGKQEGRTSPPEVESPDVRTTVHFKANPATDVVLTLSNGDPFLLEQRLGEGSVCLFSVPPTLSWSNFPLKGLFVPLIQRTIAYVAQSGAGTSDYVAGEKATIRLSRPDAGRLRVVNPLKVESVVQAVQGVLETAIPFDETNVPGIYSVYSNQDLVQQFAVNIDGRETELGRADDARIAALMNRVGIPPAAVSRISRASDIRPAILESRYGTELWKAFLIAAILVALVEMAVANFGIRREPETPLAAGTT